jgi:16S rRNA (guanine966-N2)-methyltransferase
MRIIAGTAKGRRLRSLGGETRPMTDRVREGVFSSLAALVPGAGVLDLFAGTGSIGLEALSRGAASVIFVERSRRALQVLRSNIAAVDLGGKVVGGDVESFLSGPPTEDFDLAFVDPPYDLSLPSVQSILDRLAPWLAGEATVVLHRRAGSPPAKAPAGLTMVDRRRYGDSEITRMKKEAT